MMRFLASFVLFLGSAYAATPDITVSYRVIPGHRAIKLTFKQTAPSPGPKIVRIFLVGPSGKREITSGLSGTPQAAGTVIETDIAENDATEPKDETQVEVVLQNPDADLTGPIVFPADAKKTLANLKSSLAATVASEKSTADKDIFAGMTVTVPSGGDAQGSGDFVFNHQFFANQVLNGALFDNVNLGLDLKKSSAQGTDSRHFQAGLTMQKTFLFSRQKFKQAQQEIASDDIDTAQKALNEVPHHFWPSLFFDNGISFEGDVRSVSIGNVSNFVFNSQLKLASATAQFSKAGFFFMRVIPAGVEAGYNLQNVDAPALDGNTLARYKAGGTLTLRYDSQNNATLNRIDLELNAVDRYLFLRELTLDPTTNLVTRLDKGNKYYAEGNLKFYFFRVGKGRPGFKVSFKRGYLPPAFAFTKGFDAGFFYESADDKTNTK
jgi:hypothetical protein